MNMTVSSFLYSLILVLIARIPLLVKLYLDYKGKRNALRDELLRKQLDAYGEISHLLTSLHWALYRAATFTDIQARLEKNEVEDVPGAKTDWSEFKAWEEAIQCHELLLPAELVKELWDYKVAAIQLFVAGLSFSSVRDQSQFDALWQSQTDRFNRIVNLMRILAGIDVLSAEILKLLASESKLTVIRTDFDKQLG